jgi:PAS domain S-box-containing protein
VIYFNRAFNKLTGYTPDEIVGKSPSILQGPKTDMTVIDRLREDLANRRVFHGKTVNYRKDGSEFFMEWKIFPILDRHQRTALLLAIQRISEDGV